MRSEAFRVKQTKREWPDLFPLKKKKAQPKTKEPAPATPPPRLVVVRPDIEVATPSPKAAPLRWFHAGQGLPNESEVLFYALLVVQHAQTASDAKKWAEELLVHYERINSSNTWPPADVAGLHWQGSRAPPLLKLLYDAYNAMWIENDLTKIAKAMLCFQGPGRFVEGDLRASHLRTYKDAHVQGPPQGPKKRTKARYLSAAVVEVARLVQREISTLRQLLMMESPIEEVVTVSMELQSAKEHVVALQESLSETQSSLMDSNEKLKKICDAHRKAMSRARDIRAEKAAAKVKANLILKQRITDARKREKSRTRAAREKRAQLFREAREKGKEMGQRAAATELERRVEEVARARKRARDSEYAAAQSKKRLSRAQKAEAELKEAKDTLEEYQEALEAAESAAVAAKESYTVVVDRVAAMPTWRRVRGAGHGRGRASLEWTHVVTMWEMHALGVPPSAIPKCIVNVVKRTAPWLSPVAPTYYKGKGKEFKDWTMTNYPSAFIMLLERAEGGRMDLDFDAAVPMYINRKFIVEWLSKLVFAAAHKNILEDFIYVSHITIEYVAMMRTNALVDLRISRPMRWLSGKSAQLVNWSPFSMGRVLEMLEDLFERASQNGALLLARDLDIWSEFKEEQPAFKEFLDYMFTKETIMSPDGGTKHFVYKLALDEVLNPTDPTNIQTQSLTIQYIEVQCTAALRKLHDKRTVLPEYLPSQYGSQCFAKQAQGHADTMGCEAANDKFSESVFGMHVRQDAQAQPEYFSRGCIRFDASNA